MVYNHIYFVYYLSTIFVIYLTLFFISHNVFLVFPVCKHPLIVAYHESLPSQITIKVAGAVDSIFNYYDWVPQNKWVELPRK